MGGSVKMEPLDVVDDGMMLIVDIVNSFRQLRIWWWLNCDSEGEIMIIRGELTIISLYFICIIICFCYFRGYFSFFGVFDDF